MRPLIVLLMMICAIVAKVDQDHDGRVSHDEFEKAFDAHEAAAADESTSVTPHGGYAVQIVKSDGKGGLEVVPEGLEILKSLGTLHVVSVMTTPRKSSFRPSAVIHSTHNHPFRWSGHITAARASF